MSSSVLPANEKNLVIAFIQYLRQKISSGNVSEDQQESLEVAIQCIEASFDLVDADYAFQPSRPLPDLFAAAEGLSSATAKQENAGNEQPSEAAKAKAESLKNEGNDLMRDGKFSEALQKYNDAIHLHRSPVFFCNRAASHSKMDHHDLAIQDCRTALALDSNYGKAYGRMGLALSCQNRYTEAAEAYRKALELEPTNESFRNNLEIAEQKVREQQQQQPQSAPNPMGGFDMASLLNNPAMVQMAQQMMSDPAMQNMMANMVGGAANQPGGTQGIGSLLQAGQQMAAQLQNQNPDLVEHLRRQFQGGGSQNDGNPDQGGPPPGGNPPGQ